MRVMLNGAAHETAATTVAELVGELALDEAAVATAVNGMFVARAARVRTNLQSGDAIEVLAPMQGG